MRRLDLALIVLVLAGAYGVKRHFSDAPIEELDYILRPTTALVTATTGTEFTWQPGEGYMSREAYFLIARPCAGVNFWIVAACASVFAFVGTRRTAGGKLLLAAGSVVVGFLATVVANAVRIAVAVLLHTRVGALGPLDGGRLHHIEGVAVYTFFLCVFFLVARRALAPREAV